MARKPALGVLLLLAIYGVVALRAGTLLGADSDYLVHRAYGRALLAARTVWLPEDPTIFTTPGVAPILHEWGAEALFAALAALLGDWGPIRLAALLASVVPWLLYRRALQLTGSLWPALGVWMVAAIPIATGLLVRPHLFSLLAFVLAYHLLECWRAGDRRAFGVLAALVVVWTNLHGGGAIVLYAALAGVFAIGQRRRADAALVLGSYALTLVNPWGPRLHLHVARFLVSAAPHAAADMGPPPLLSGAAVVLVAIALLLVALRRPLRDADRAPRALVGVTFVLSCLSMRSLPFLGIALALLLPQPLDEWARAVRPALAARSRALAGEERGSRAVLALLVLLTFAPVRWLLGAATPAGPRIPAEAITWLRANPALGQQRGYAGYDDSGFLLGAGVVPRVYLHSLNANTPLRLADDEAVLSSGAPGWDHLLRAHDVAWVLLPPDDPLAARVGAAGWSIAWRGAKRTLYHRP